MKPTLAIFFMVSALATSVGAATVDTSNTPASAQSDLDVLAQKGQTYAPKGGVAVFMSRGISYMSMTVTGHEAPCDFTLFNQSREFSRFQMTNRAPFSYCIVGQTGNGTLVKVAIADFDSKPRSGRYIVGGQVAGDMVPAYWDDTSRTLVMAGYRMRDVDAPSKEPPSSSVAKTLVCGVPITDLAGERPNIGKQVGTCAELRAMYYALGLLSQANADLKAENFEKAAVGFASVSAWLTSNKVESIELVEAKLGEGKVHSEKKDYPAAAAAYTEARDLLKRIDPSWSDMRLVIGWRLAKALAESKQFEAGMREMVRLNEAPYSCREKCKEGLINTLDRYIGWAKRNDREPEQRLLSARKLVLKGEDD